MLVWLPKADARCLTAAGRKAASNCLPECAEHRKAPPLDGQPDRAGHVALDKSFCKTRRLLGADDYSRVFDAPDARASHRNLLLLARRNTGPRHRLGLVVAKKNVKLAVQRNRLKRVTREFFRQLPASEPPLDVIVLARRGLGELDNTELSSILRQQWLKLERHARRSAPDSRPDTTP